MNNCYPFELKPLPYDYSALEPCISKTTMGFHHDKHLQGYVNNLNQALSQEESLQKLSLEYILSHLDEVPATISTAVTNNAGGVFNHNFFFEALSAPSSTKMSNELETQIVKTFGSIEEFFSLMKKAALSQFGSGWAWLVVDKDNNLQITTTSNQETPLKHNHKPLLVVDVWEHAYYLDYQNRRGDYIDSWFKTINWDIISKRFIAMK